MGERVKNNDYPKKSWFEYFFVGDGQLIRISDFWSESGWENSKKFNNGMVNGSCYRFTGGKSDTVSHKLRGNMYPSIFGCGIAAVHGVTATTPIEACFSRCRIGKDRWQWIAFDGLDWETPMANGIAQSPEQALADAEIRVGSLCHRKNSHAESFRKK